MLCENLPEQKFFSSFFLSYLLTSHWHREKIYTHTCLRIFYFIAKKLGIPLVPCALKCSFDANSHQGPTTQQRAQHQGHASRQCSPRFQKSYSLVGETEMSINYTVTYLALSLRQKHLNSIIPVCSSVKR